MRMGMEKDLSESAKESEIRRDEEGLVGSGFWSGSREITSGGYEDSRNTSRDRVDGVREIEDMRVTATTTTTTTMAAEFFLIQGVFDRCAKKGNSMGRSMRLRGWSEN